jgi:hypothetical protein
MKRRLIWFAILIPAAFYLLLFLTEGFPSVVRTLKLDKVELVVSTGALPILTALAIGIGLINVFGVHGANILKRRKGWPFSVVVFASCLVLFPLMLWQYHIDGQRRVVTEVAETAWQRMANAQKLPTVTERDAELSKLTAEDWAAIHRLRAFEDEYRFEPRMFCLDYLLTPLGSTVMALLGYYITYAAYRAFRIRSLEATLMMISATVVILGSDPFGGWLTRGWGAWVAEIDNGVINSGMQRGLQLGIAVAVIAASLRMMLGLERGIVEVRQEGQ